MIKIDYFAGAYGNFLKYIINRYVYRIESAKKFSPFNSLGCAHLNTSEYIKESKVEASNYSFQDTVSQPAPNTDDTLIRITIDKLNRYHVYYNSISRAGDISIDLKHPEINTLRKIEELTQELKLKNPLFYSHTIGKLNTDQLIKDYGIRINYPRSAIRNYYYSALREDHFFLNKTNKFVDFEVNSIIEFPVDAFTSMDKFVREIEKLGKILTNRYIKLDQSFSEIYNTFLSNNLGFQSQRHCNKIINDILAGNNANFDVDILEEAWINCNITEIFNIHEGIECFSNVYPDNTNVMYNHIMEQLS